MAFCKSMHPDLWLRECKFRVKFCEGWLVHMIICMVYSTYYIFFYGDWYTQSSVWHIVHIIYYISLCRKSWRTGHWHWLGAHDASGWRFHHSSEWLHFTRHTAKNLEDSKWETCWCCSQWHGASSNRAEILGSWTDCWPVFCCAAVWQKGVKTRRSSGLQVVARQRAAEAGECDGKFVWEGQSG